MTHGRVHRRRLPERVPARRRHRRQRDRHGDLHAAPARPARPGPATPARSSSSTPPARWAGPSSRRPRSAASAAIDQILDGTWFAVVAGTHQAYLAYPAGPRRRRHGADGPADPASRRSRPIAQFRSDGGTAMGTWLTLAGRLFDSVPDAGAEARDPAHRRREPQRDARAADQRDRRASPASSSATAAASASTGRSPRCAGSPRRCSAPSTSSREPEQMAAGVRRADAAVDGPRRRRRPAAGLGAAGRPGACSSARSSPTVEDLTAAPDRGQPADRRLPDRVLGRRVPRLPRQRPAVGQGRSARSSWRPGSSWRVGDEVVAQGLVKAKWSDDEGLTTRINPEVAHYTGQTELAEAIQEGLAAKAAGDDGDRDHEARPGRPAGRRRPATTRPPPGCARSSTSTTRRPVRCG